MKTVLRLILFVAFLAVGFWLWSVFFPSPEKAIRNRLTKAARLASFNAGEGNITRVANIEALGTYFTDEIEIKVDVPNYESHTFTRREELTQAAMAARSVVSSVKADFPDIAVDLDPGNQTAAASVTLRVDINGEKNSVIQELKIYLKKVNGDWLIYRLDTIRTLH
jgi:hypothetical protein